MPPSKKTKRQGRPRRPDLPATRQRSFRLPQTTLDRLERQAKAAGGSANALAQRLIEEGLRTDEHPLIWFREAGGGERVPAIVGTRLDVWQVVELLRMNDNSIEEVADLMDMPQHFVQAAVGYYASYKEEIDAHAKEQKEFADRAHAAWRREQEVLG